MNEIQEYIENEEENFDDRHRARARRGAGGRRNVGVSTNNSGGTSRPKRRTFSKASCG